MTGNDVQTGVTVLQKGLTSLHAAAGPHGTETDRIAVLSGLAAVEQQLHRVIVDTVAALQRDGSFTAHGQRPVTALCDLLGVEYRDARRLVTAAEQVCPRIDLQGQELPALLPATAAAFQSGAVSLRHVEIIAKLMTSPAARRLPPETQAGAEVQIAAMAAGTAPTETRTGGSAVLLPPPSSATSSARQAATVIGTRGGSCGGSASAVRGAGVQAQQQVSGQGVEFQGVTQPG